jgi:hypothetical protein
VGTKNVVHDKKQLGAKSNDKQVKYNTPIKFKGAQDAPHTPQAKAKVVPAKSNKKSKPHASQDNLFADYVLTWAIRVRWWPSMWNSTQKAHWSKGMFGCPRFL